MTSVPVRLALFAALLAATFGAAAALGGAVDPDTDTSGSHDDGAAMTATHSGSTAGHEAGEEATTQPAALPGLAVAQDGYRLELASDRATRGTRRPLAFRILDADGHPVRRFDLAHGKRMHVIVVRRDLAGFQHLHPTRDADGTWRTTAALAQAGSWRVFADFTIDGTQRTLGADLQVPGDVRPATLPAPAATTRSDRGATVALHREGARVTFTVRDRDGSDVTGHLQPYLGAKGHLVALRAADLAYLHTHPDGDTLAFETHLPSAGAYRLFVQFRLDGVIHTAAFTEEATA